MGMLNRAEVNYQLKHYGNGETYGGGLIISPIRDPWMCYITHRTRKRDPEWYWKAWREFNQYYVSGYPMCIIPVDTQNRDLYLQQASKKLGVELTTTWRPAGSLPRKEQEPIDLTEIYSLPVVKKFYSGPDFDRDWTEGMRLVIDPILKRIEHGIPKETIMEVFGLSEDQYQEKLNEVFPPKEVKPKKAKKVKHG